MARTGSSANTRAANTVTSTDLRRRVIVFSGLESIPQPPANTDSESTPIEHVARRAIDPSGPPGSRKAAHISPSLRVQVLAGPVVGILPLTRRMTDPPKRGNRQDR